MAFEVSGQIVDIHQRRIVSGTIQVDQGKIVNIIEQADAPQHYIMPGFIDAHVHIESSLLIPSEFARLAVLHGTVATVSDPHEIANVLGVEGVDFMIENGKQVPFHFFFGAPSCVPATTFETAGAQIDAKAVEQLLARDEILYLSEMMNFPGVLHQDAEVMAKIAAAKRLNKPVDGHAPGLRGAEAAQYIQAGISTDHECFTIEEAQEKLALGMKIIIREGSAARNFEELIPLIEKHADRIMLCSDDKHPDSLLEGHINQLAARAVGKGYQVFDVLQAACLNPIHHYKLPVGQLRVGDQADFIIVKDLEHFKVEQTYIKGEPTIKEKEGRSRIESISVKPVNQFVGNFKQAADFKLEGDSEQVRVIEALEGQLITRTVHHRMQPYACTVGGEPEHDILKIVVVNRYHEAPPAIAFVKGFGLKQGAIASSVAHDSHNIIAVGVDNESIAKAVNEIIMMQGGLSAVAQKQVKTVALPVAGLMSHSDAYEVAQQYMAIDQMAKQDLDSVLKAPFMTLSFMALLVIPELKLSDKGLFDGNAFRFVSVFE